MGGVTGTFFFFFEPTEEKGISVDDFSLIIFPYTAGFRLQISMHLLFVCSRRGGKQQKKLFHFLSLVFFIYFAA